MMKKAYEAPKAVRFEFDYAENVTASQTGGISYDTTDYSNPDWECHTRYADAQWVCGYDGHDLSNPQWKCELK